MINFFAWARRYMSKKLKKDEDLRIGYRANIAMILYNHPEFNVSKETCSEIAEEVLKRIFD